MKHTIALIKHRLHNLEGSIIQYKHCIENNIAVHLYEEQLKLHETEEAELKIELERLLMYIIDNNDYK